MDQHANSRVREVTVANDRSVLKQKLRICLQVLKKKAEKKKISSLNLVSGKEEGFRGLLDNPEVPNGQLKFLNFLS